MHWILLFFWVCLIFYLSSIPNLSSGLKEDFFLRKAAHIFEYFVLTLLFLNAFLKTKIHFIQKSTNNKKAFFSGIFSFLYASTDEFHQSFVEGRHGSLIDLFLYDLLGVLIFLCLYFYLFSRSKQNKS